MAKMRGGGDGKNQWWSRHPYKYKYQYIWVDLVVIRRTQIMPDPLPGGDYVTHFNASTTEGLLLPFELLGQNGGPVHDYLFTVESVVANPFPFEYLSNRNSAQDSLKIGELSYYSILDSASLRLASDAAGSAVDFKLYSGSVIPIPYQVVFTPITPAGSPVHITSPYTAFDSISTTTISPIDQQQTTANVIEGDLRIFVDPNTNPIAGTYSSTIYCILTQQ